MEAGRLDPNHNITLAGENQAALVGDILGDAFCHDPVLNWALPKGQGYADLFSSSAQSQYLKHRKVFLNSAHTGAAMWLPPGIDSTTPTSFTQILKLIPMAMKHGFSALKRFGDLQAHFAAHHPKEAHYYLMAIGARQDHQGQGIGSALLKHALIEIDETGHIAYLESSNEANVPLYQRHGFETFHQEAIPGGGPMIWFMLRQPQT